MGIEIERKFLVKNDEYKKSSKWKFLKQGYLCNEADRVIKIRLNEGKGFITVKGRINSMSRSEFEYEIPYEDANAMLENLCSGPIIEKKRFEFEFKGFKWEIDEFLGENEGLVVAEIELKDENAEFPKPDWIDREVTFEPRYLNSNLVKKPYRYWDNAKVE